jgi:TPP-dependent pyruvate/acetoin dehydrogenase alpha subunit
METGVMEEIQAAVDAAEKRMGELGDPLAMFDHLYAEMPPQLEAQKSALARELADGGKEVDDE